MKKRIKDRALMLCGAVFFLLALAVMPRPAQPAVPARPVEQQTGPLTGKTILVDAGHGGNDGGARCKDSKKWEKELNLQVAKAVRSALESAGAAVVMTREEDMQYSANKREDLTARLALAKEQEADMVLSIHMNEYRSRKESGPQVFYRAGQEQSRLLAGALQEALITGLSPKKERVAMAGDYFILSLDVPSVLVECGFISNAEEEKMLLDEEYQQRLAQAIRAGVEEYFSLAEKEPGMQDR